MIDLHSWIMYIPVGYAKNVEMMKVQADVNRITED